MSPDSRYGKILIGGGNNDIRIGVGTESRNRIAWLWVCTGSGSGVGSSGGVSFVLQPVKSILKVNINKRIFGILVANFFKRSHGIDKAGKSGYNRIMDTGLCFRYHTTEKAAGRTESHTGGTMNFEESYQKLKGIGQEHLLRFWQELSAAEQDALLKQIEETDFSVVENLAHPEDLSGKGEITPIEGLDREEIEERKEEFFSIGADAIRKGKVACVLLAGGQGTRLGSDAPKGCYDIGLTKPVYIFERQIANLSDVTKALHARIPLYIMTSEKNYDETKAFFDEHDYFGYPKEDIYFFRQEMAPAADGNGKVFLEEKGKIALSPNGNGGWFASLARSGLVERMRRLGVEWVNCYAVDNVLQRMADPVFVGATIETGKNCGAKVVCKTEPKEKVGVLCLENGTPNVIEYYELSEEMANKRDESGALAFRYGVILNYLFSFSKLTEIASDRIPVHVVKKKVPFVDERGNKVVPEKENGYKFETLILDMVKLMGSVLPFEVEREREFAPIKNKTGVDSVESARELLTKNGVIL